MKKNKEAVKVYHNIPQLIFNIVKAQITICIWGRGTGKTEGPGVDYTLDNMESMPRSLGGLISVTYDKLLSIIIPKLIKGWERMGYVENTHFWLKKFAPDELKRERPYLSPTDPKHFIHWYNGAGAQLISLDRLGISNGADLDWIYADECKLFDIIKFNEVLHTNRGNSEHFGHLSQHHSVLLTTDRPQNEKGNWLYDIAKNMDEEVVEMVFTIQQRVFELNEQLKEVDTESEQEQIQDLINEFQDHLNDLRRGLVYVSEASTLDNIQAVGIDYIKNLKKSLHDIVYRISVLNERVREVEDGFYKDLNENKHGYTATDYDYIDSIEYDHKNVKRNCLWDEDVIDNQALDIGMDLNHKINNIVTGQGNGKQYRFLTSFYFKGKYQLLIKQWHEYYKRHQHFNKQVNFYFDHTFTAGKADSDLCDADKIVEELEALGWVVRRIYIGQQPRHKARYLFWEKLLNKSDSIYPEFLFNTTNCEYWYSVSKMTRAKIGRDGFEKDKSDEKKPNFPQEEAPHITDAGDTLAIGAIHLATHSTVEFHDIVVSN